MRPSPLLSAAAAAALLAAVAGPATAATGPSPAKGVASSSVTLLGVAAGGHTVSAGTLELLSDMLGAESVAKILLTPLTADGTAYGQQTVTPANSPLTSPSVSTSAVPALAGLIGVSSPVLGAAADDTDGEPSTSAGADSLGNLSVLGLPVTLNGSLDVGSAVSKAGGAVGEKTIVVEDVALPSVADLLGVLGLNLEALPIEVLNELLKELDLVNTAVTTANQALTDATAAIQAQIDAAQAEVDKAAAQLKTATDAATAGAKELDAAKADLVSKQKALQDAEAALAQAQAPLVAATEKANKATADLVAALNAAGVDSIATYEALLAPAKALLPSTIAGLYDAYKTAQAELAATTTSTQQAIATATTNVATAKTAADAAAALVKTLTDALAVLQAAVDSAQKLLDAAINVLKGILSDVQPLIDTLLGAIMAVLDGTPLVSFDTLAVVTEATATSNTEGGQSAKVVGGEITGLKVLGTDVLSDVLGTTSVDLLDLAGTQLSAVNALIADLTGTLSSVLSTVPQFPTLSIPAPEVGLLTKSASTDIVDGFGVASTSVKGLSITIPSVSIPTALALPGAADLPALDGITQVAGLLTSSPVKIDLATLSSNARFAPAVGATPGTSTPGTQTPGTQTPGTAAPQLPRTGASQALAVLGVALMAGAIAARRRSTEVSDLV